MAEIVGILTISDTRTMDTDKSGAAAQTALSEMGFSEFQRVLVPDEIERIQNAILSLTETCLAVFTTGGTGFAPRDVTPEATAPLLDRRADSLCELMRLRGLESTPYAHLSRGIAGMRGKCLVVNLPGSPAAVTQGLGALSPLLRPILNSLHGDGCSAH